MSTLFSGHFSVGSGTSWLNPEAAYDNDTLRESCKPGNQWTYFKFSLPKQAVNEFGVEIVNGSVAMTYEAQMAYGNENQITPVGASVRQYCGVNDTSNIPFSFDESENYEMMQHRTDLLLGVRAFVQDDTRGSINEIRIRNDAGNGNLYAGYDKIRMIYVGDKPIKEMYLGDNGIM